MVKFTPRRIALGIGASVIALGLLFSANKLVDDVGPDELVVIQAPISGKLTWYTSPGLVWQGFGEATHYKKRATFSFDQTREGVKLRFTDGGHGFLHGSIQFDLPVNVDQLNTIHMKYRTMDAVRKEIIERVTENAIYLSGPLMSSRESYAEKRADLIHYILDQVQNGIYKTRQKTVYIKDPITNQEKQVTAAEIIMDTEGKPVRQEGSVLSPLGIKAFNFVIKQMPYDEVVEKQILQQQELAMEVQTAIAKAKRAEQEALTAEQEGKANAVKTKWEQETIKAKEVTKAGQEKEIAEIQAEKEKKVAETNAQQRKNVADLDKQTAELTKQTQILLGEGESERKRLVLAADGALERKLEAYIEVNRLYAAAIKDYKGNWVPTTVMGQGTSTQVNGAQTLIDLLTAKAAKDLSLDLSVRK